MGAISANASGGEASRSQPIPGTPDFPEPHLSSSHTCSCNVPSWEESDSMPVYAFKRCHYK